MSADLLARIRELAGSAVVDTVQREFGGAGVYIRMAAGGAMEQPSTSNPAPVIERTVDVREIYALIEYGRRIRERLVLVEYDLQVIEDLAESVEAVANVMLTRAQKGGAA